MELLGTDAVSGSAEDAIVQLRVWGTRHVRLLPSTPDRCEMLPGGAVLAPTPEGWCVRDRLGRPVTWLAPGSVVTTGGIALVAESPRMLRLRSLLERLLGWERLAEVDSALQTLQMAHTQPLALMLYVDDHPYRIAHSLHEATRGDAGRLVVCDSRCATLPRRRGWERVEMFSEVSGAALDAARGGTLCFSETPAPREISGLLDELRARPFVEFQTIVCTSNMRSARRYCGPRIIVPPLSTRSEDVHRLVDEYLAQAISALAEFVPVSSSDRAWLALRSASSLAEIETGAQRLAALRHTGGVCEAARLIGVTHGALVRWLHRRKFPGNDRRRLRSAVAQATDVRSRRHETRGPWSGRDAP